MRILIIALVFISSVAKGQIQDFQLKGKLPKDTLWIMGTDTASASTKYGLGKWYHADSLISNIVGAAAGDHDWYDIQTGTTPLLATDSIVTANGINYVLYDSAKIESYTPNFNNWYAWTQRSQTNSGTNGYLANRKINFDGLSAPALTEPYGRFGEWIEQFSWDNSINAGFEDGGNLLANFGFNYDTGDPNYNDLRPGFKWSVEQGYYPGSGSTMWVESHWEHTDTLGRTFRPISIAAAYDGSFSGFSATSDLTTIFQSPDQVVGDGQWEKWDYPSGTHDIWYDYHGRINNVYTGTVLEKYSNTIVAPTYRNILTHDADDDLWVGDSTGIDITNKLRFRINGYSTPLIKSNNETLQFDTVFVNFLGSSGGTNRNFTLQKVGDSDKMLFGFDGATMNVGKFNDDEAIFRIHQDAPNYSFGIRSSGKIDFNINGAYGGIDFRQFSDDLAGGWMTRDAAQSYYLGNYLDGSDHWVWNFNGNEYYRFKSNGQINATQYDATPLTGTPFRLLSHETDGDFISATWAQVVDSLEANGMTGGATDLTIGGSGPTYTIESSTGTDVTISANPGISLGESPANTLVISNDGVVEGVNASDATHHYFDLLDFSASSLGTLTLTEGTNITLTTSGTSANGIVTIAATEVDGSVTNEAWTIDGDDADTELISNQTYKFEGAGILTTDVVPASDKIILTATEVDGSTTNELIEIEENNVSEGTGMLRLDFINPFDVAVVGAEADISLDLDEITTDVTPEGDEYVVGSDGAATNEKWAITNFDLSSTNEAWTADADDADTEVITNQTVVMAGDTGIIVDYIPASNTFSFDIKGDDFTTVTTAESTDYLLIHDENGTSNDVLEKMLWSDFVIDIIGFEEDNVNEGNGNTFDFGTGLDLSVTGAEADISLDFNEFATDAATEGDEYVILYDPSAADEEKVLITSLGGADGNGIYDGSGTVPTATTATLTDNITFNAGASEADIFIDGTNDLVGIGTNSPEEQLTVSNEDSNLSYPIMAYHTDQTGSGSSVIGLTKYYYGSEDLIKIEGAKTTSTGTNDSELTITMEDASNADIDAISVDYEEAYVKDYPRTRVFGGVQMARVDSLDASTTLDESYYSVRATTSGITITLMNANTTNGEFIGMQYIIFNDSGADITINPGGTNDYVNGSTSDITLPDKAGYFLTLMSTTGFNTNHWVGFKTP